MIGTYWRWARGVAAALGFLVILITATPVLRYWVAALSGPWGPGSGDTLIVLGQEMTAPGMLGVGSYWRTYYAVLVWREQHFSRVVVTGKDAAPLMRDLMVDQGVPRERIVVEDAAGSTRENAVFVARLLRGTGGTKVLLTSDYHSGRALRAFRKAGVEATVLPFPDAGKRFNVVSERWSVFLTLVDETARVVWYRVKGWA